MNVAVDFISRALKYEEELKYEEDLKYEDCLIRPNQTYQIKPTKPTKTNNKTQSTKTSWANARVKLQSQVHF